MRNPRRGRTSERRSYQRELLQAIGRYLPHRGLPLVVPDERVRWPARLLVVVALLMGWQRGAATLRDAFEAAREAAVAMYASRRRPGRSVAGFVGALRRRGSRLLETVVKALREATERMAGPAWRYQGYVAMGVDGTRIACPRTKANEAAFGYGGKANGMPQQMLTTLFHVGTGLPWDWRRGRGDVSERGHARQMLEGLPAETMLLMDAGFPGFGLLWALQERGHAFIVRAGRNVRLLRELGYDVEEDAGTVYLWPQGQRDHPPLVLRWVVVRDGGIPVHLLTSVRSPTALSDGQIADLYRRRWGIEVLYRGFKQTMGKRKMLSTTAEPARLELDWALAGLWMLGLMTGETLADQGQAPGGWSVAGALRVMGRAMRRPQAAPPAGGLWGQLGRAGKDSYRRTRPKASRDYPRQKVAKPPGAPKIRTATKPEVQRAQELWKQKDAA